MPGSYTPRGRQLDSVVKYLMGADQAGNDLPLRLQGLQCRYLMNMMYRPRDPQDLEEGAESWACAERARPTSGTGSIPAWA